MSVKLTAPVVKHEEVFLAPKEIIISIPHLYEAALDAMKVDALGFTLRCDYGVYDAEGKKVNRIASFIKWADLPQGGKDMIKQMYEWLENKGETDGIIGAGTKVDLETGEPAP